MFNFNTNANQLMSLQLGLKEFGLKPIEWRVIKKTDSKFVIQSTDATDFYFVGEVKANNSLQWKYIQLAGIY